MGQCKWQSIGWRVESGGGRLSTRREGLCCSIKFFKYSPIVNQAAQRSPKWRVIVKRSCLNIWYVVNNVHICLYCIAGVSQNFLRPSSNLQCGCCKLKFQMEDIYDGGCLRFGPYSWSESLSRIIISWIAAPDSVLLQVVFLKSTFTAVTVVWWCARHLVLISVPGSMNPVHCIAGPRDLLRSIPQLQLVNLYNASTEIRQYPCTTTANPPYMYLPNPSPNPTNPNPNKWVRR